MLILNLDRTQQTIVRPPPQVRNLTWIAGRRRGKSDAAKAAIIDEMLGKTNRKFLYIVPWASQFQELYDFFRHDPQMESRLSTHGCKTQPVHHLTFARTGGYLEFRSMEKLIAIKSREFNRVWADEIQDTQCSYEDFAKVLKPMLLNRVGNLTVSGQFHGKNWVYDKLYLRGVKGHPSYDPAYLSIVSKTTEAPFFQTEAGRTVLAQDRKEFTDAMWAEQYDCEVVDGTGTVFRRLEGVLGGIPHHKPQPGCKYILFWDTGKTHDPAAVVVIERRSGLVCVAQELELGLEYSAAAKWVQTLRTYYNNAVCAIDLTGAGTQDGVLDLMRPIVPGLQGLYFTQRYKEALVNQAQVEIEMQRLCIPLCFTNLISQLEHYECEQDPITGRYWFHAPRGEHDDLVMALIGALFMRSENMGNAKAPAGIFG